MKTILFIHGGGEGAHAADEKLAASLRTALGDGYQVVHPLMPNEDSPDYAAWRYQITTELAALPGPVILVGHSLGASVGLKYLSENQTTRAQIAAFFGIAVPYWGAPDWEVDEYALCENFTLPDRPLFLYFSRDDEVVPFTHRQFYADQIPQATIRDVAGRNHQFNDDLSGIAADIMRLA